MREEAKPARTGVDESKRGGSARVREGAQPSCTMACMDDDSKCGTQSASHSLVFWWLPSAACWHSFLAEPTLDPEPCSLIYRTCTPTVGNDLEVVTHSFFSLLRVPPRRPGMMSRLSPGSS